MGKTPSFVLKVKHFGEKEIWKNVRSVVCDIGNMKEASADKDEV